MKDFVVGSFQDTQGKRADDVLRSPCCATVRRHFDRVLVPVWVGVSIGRRLPEDVRHSGGKVEQRLGQVDVELVNEGSHPVRHLDVFARQVLERAVENGRDERQVVANVRPEVEDHRAENGVGALTDGTLEILAELLVGETLPFLFKVLL